MKKLFAIAAVVAVALTSCVKNEIVEPAGNEITFKDFTLSSKALIHPGANAEEALPTTCTFGAFALYTGSYEAVVDETTHIGNLEVSHNGSNWVYNTTQYWPTDESRTLDFYAYYPYKADATWNKTENTPQLVGLELGTTLNDQTDWMVSYPSIGNNKTNAAAGVPIVFKHITSMIVFKAADITPEARYQNLVKINKIEVIQAAYKGNYHTAWYNQGERADVVVYNDGAGVAVTPAGVDVTNATSNALIVVPESVKAATEFVVDYTIAESADRVIHAHNGTVTIKTKDLTTTWEPGKKYVYTINFDLINGTNENLTEIKFVPTVEEWAEVGADYFV